MSKMRASRIGTALGVVLLMPLVHAEEMTISRFIDEDTDRIPVHTVVPIYPQVARRDRIEGQVQLCYHIDKKGRPYRIAVRKSTHRIFEKPAKLAIRASTYKPLEPGEKRSGIKTCRTFRFELTPVATEDDG